MLKRLVYLQLTQDRTLAEYWAFGATRYDTMDGVDKYRFTCILLWWLNIYENIFYQHKNGMLDDTSHEPWEYDLSQFVIQQPLGKFLPDLHDYFQLEFAHHVEDLIKIAH